MEPTKLQYVTVKTTLPLFPYPPLPSRQPITTPNLILRPLLASDLEDFFILRSSPEAMASTAKGIPDENIEVTREVLRRYLPPNDSDTYTLAICERETERFVGIGGSLEREGELGWPGIGYALLPEVWGKGYGSEFIGAFMGIWWGLERGEAVVKVERMSLSGEGREVEEEGEGVRERIVGIVQEGNVASRRVLGKGGFQKMAEWVAEKRDGSGLERVFVFACKRPE